jgi:WD40 repeat protein
MCLDAARQFPGPGVAASQPDGRAVLIAVAEGAVQLFDADTGLPLGPRMEPGPRNAVWGEVMQSGSEWVALTYGSKAVRLWNATTGQLLGPVIEPDPAGAADRHEVLFATIRPDRQAIAVGTSHGVVRVWEVATGKPLGKPLRHEGPIHDMCFTPDGRMLLTGCTHRPGDPILPDATTLLAKMLTDTGKNPDEVAKTLDDIKHHAAGIARFWDLSGSVLVWCHTMPNPVTSVGVSPDSAGRYLAVGAFAVYVYDSKEKKMTTGGRMVDNEPANWTAFHPKEPGTMFMARTSGDVEILRVLDEKSARTGERLSPQGLVVGAGFREDQGVFTLNRDGTMRLWRRPLVQKAEEELHHHDAVLSVAFGPDGATVATACRDGSVYLWPADRSAKRTFTPSRKKADALPLTQVRVSPDGRRVVAQDLHFDQFVWETATGRPVTPPAGESLVGVADDGATALVRLPDLTYRVRDLLTGQVGRPFLIPGGVGPDPGHEFDPTTMLRVTRVAFSPDRSVVAAIDGAGRVLLWRAAAGELVGRPIAHAARGGAEMIRAVAFSPDGTRLVTQSFRTRGVWNAATTAELDLLHNPVGVQLSRFSPCGRLVLSATNFNMAQLCDVSDRSLRPAALLHAAQVWGVTASADCSRVLTASYDRTARDWDVATGKPLSPPLLHGEGVSEVVCSPDGKRILTGSWDRTARLWPTVSPVPDEVERVTVWVETMTGLRIGPTGSSDLLTADEWNERKRRLDELGGPPWTHVKPGK